MAKDELTDLQQKVLFESYTEPPFSGEYDDFYEEGLYVDPVSGEVLFSSKDKFDAGCGWPAFTKPVNETEVTEIMDHSHGMTRVEVRSESSGGHLGHVFEDGPLEKGGLRYCINSAALKFIPVYELANAGYADYLPLFDENK